MPGRSNRSGRVVICDDVSWSEPAPQGRRTATESEAALRAPRYGVATDVPPGFDRSGDDFDALEDRFVDDSRGGYDVDDPRDRYHSGGRRDDLYPEDPRDGSDPDGPHAVGPAEPSGWESGADEGVAFDFDQARRVARMRSASRSGGRRRSSVKPRADEPDELEESAERLEAETAWGPRPRLMSSEPGGRRTVVITGHGTDRQVAPRGGSRTGALEHAGLRFSADRTAMWAVLLCVIVLLVAITSH